MREPTLRQREIHAFMLRQQRELGMPATLREIAEAFGFASATAVLDHLRLMAKKGMVTCRGGRARGWVAKEFGA